MCIIKFLFIFEVPVKDGLYYIVRSLIAPDFFFFFLGQKGEW